MAGGDGVRPASLQPIVSAIVRKIAMDDATDCQCIALTHPHESQISLALKAFVLGADFSTLYKLADVPVLPP